MLTLAFMIITPNEIKTYSVIYIKYLYQSSDRNRRLLKKALVTFRKVAKFCHRTCTTGFVLQDLYHRTCTTGLVPQDLYYKTCIKVYGSMFSLATYHKISIKVLLLLKRQTYLSFIIYKKCLPTNLNDSPEKITQSPIYCLVSEHRQASTLTFVRYQ